MSKLKNLALNKYKTMTAEQMKKIAGGYGYDSGSGSGGYSGGGYGYYSCIVYFKNGSNELLGCYGPSKDFCATLSNFPNLYAGANRIECP